MVYVDPDNQDSIVCLRGSYLFNNGFFAALDYIDDSDNSQSVVSAGYRFNLPNEAGYITATIDYSPDSDFYGEDGIVDYEVNGKYYTKNSRIYGQVIIPNEDLTGTDKTYVKVGGAYKVAENIVIGGKYIHDHDKQGIYEFDLNIFTIGLTANFERLGFDFQHNIRHFNGIDKHIKMTRLSALYSFTENLRAGLEVTDIKDVDDLYLTAKLKYAFDKQNELIFMHQFENDSNNDDAVTYLRWNYKF